MGGHFTVLIFSGSSSKVKRYKVPRPILWSLIFAIPLLLVAAVLLGLSYVRHPEHTQQTAEFQEKNRVQQQAIRSFSERITELQNQIAQMREFDSKLRVIANLENQPSSLFGVGGPVPDDRREKMRNQKGADPSEEVLQSGSALPVLGGPLSESDRDPGGGLAVGAGDRLPYVPSIWPTRGWIIGEFGRRVSPVTGDVQMQEGIRISNSLGTPIIAPAEGLVVTIGTDPDYGRMVVLSHGHGIVTRYGHLGEIDVEIGQRVERGETIGKMGNTGPSVGPQLYYEVRVSGVPVDPRNFL